MGDPKIPAGARSYQLSDQFKQKLADKASDKVIKQDEINELSQDASLSEQQFIAEVLADKGEFTMKTRKSTNHDPNQVDFDIQARVERNAATASPESRAADQTARSQAGPSGASSGSSTSTIGDGKGRSYQLSKAFEDKLASLTSDAVLDKSDFDALAQGASADEKRYLDDMRKNRVSAYHHVDPKQTDYVVIPDQDVSADFLKAIHARAKDGVINQVDREDLRRLAKTKDEQAYLSQMLSFGRIDGMSHLGQDGQLHTVPSLRIDAF